MQTQYERKIDKNCYLNKDKTYHMLCGYSKRPSKKVCLVCVVTCLARDFRSVWNSLGFTSIPLREAHMFYEKNRSVLRDFQMLAILLEDMVVRDKLDEAMIVFQEILAGDPKYIT